MHDAASQEIVLNLLKTVFITLTNIMSGDNNKYDTKIDSDNYKKSYNKYKYIFQYLGFKDTLYAACIAHIKLHFLNHIKDEGTDETKKKNLNEAYENLKNLIENNIDPAATLVGVKPVAQEYKFNPFNIKLNPKFEINQEVDCKDEVFIVLEYDFLTEKYTVGNEETSDVEDKVDESNLKAHIQSEAGLPIWKQKILYTKDDFQENYNALLVFMDTLDDLDIRFRPKFKKGELGFVEEITNKTNHFTLIDILKKLLESDYYKTKYNLYKKKNFLELVKIILDQEEINNP